jgi:hypothetical protein
MSICPKCQGGTFLSEEELVQVLENTDPVKVLIKATYQCMSCSERFTRLVSDDLSARRRPGEAAPHTQNPYAVQQAPAQPAAASSSGDPAEGLKFF